MLEKNKILSYLKEYKDRYKDIYHIDKLGLFGSVARGENAQDSDLDIVVDMSKPNLLNLSSIREDLMSYFKTDVDIVAIWKNMNPRLKKRIEKEAIYV